MLPVGLLAILELALQELHLPGKGFHLAHKLFHLFVLHVDSGHIDVAEEVIGAREAEIFQRFIIAPGFYKEGNGPLEKFLCRVALTTGEVFFTDPAPHLDELPERVQVHLQRLLIIPA